MQWIQNHWGDLRGQGRRYRHPSITRRDGGCHGAIANVPDGMATGVLAGVNPVTGSTP